jgi:cardiolipin synthase
MFGAIVSTIARAKQRVWLTFGYFVPDPLTRQTLIDAARRGVDVRLVLPGFSDFWAPVYAGRSSYADLLEAKVRIYERRDALMHAKTAVIDSEWSSIGSTNLDWRSFVHNYEADLVVYDASFARELERRFELDVESSSEVKLEEWKRRGALEQMKEWLARRWEYLL